MLGAIETYAKTGEGDVVRLVNIKPPQYRLREGDWRVRFKKHVQEEMLEILHIRPRGKAYSPRRENK